MHNRAVSSVLLALAVALVPATVTDAAVKDVPKPKVRIVKRFGTSDDGKRAVFIPTIIVDAAYGVGTVQYACGKASDDCIYLNGIVTTKRLRRGVYRHTIQTSPPGLYPLVLTAGKSLRVLVRKETCTGGKGPWRSGPGSTCRQTPGWLNWMFETKVVMKRGRLHTKAQRPVRYAASAPARAAPAV
jgi:hypothetical protein